MKLRTLLLAATALAGFRSAALAGDLSFAPLAFAGADAARRGIGVSQSVTLDGRTSVIGYHILARSGDVIGGKVFGQLADKDGKPLMAGAGAAAVSDRPDFTSLLPVGGRLYSISHFEEAPAAMYLSELRQDAHGALTPVSTRPIDFAAVGGVWNPCAGVVTPWNTHLGSEEYPADARGVAVAATTEDIDEDARQMARYFGLNSDTMTPDEFRAAFNPYRFGFPVEVAVSEAGEAKVAKHYAMGRISLELAQVMPDQKTAYLSNDGTNSGLFMFVADKAGDLSAGNLSAAKWVQTSAGKGGAAALEWVDLGHADDATVQAAIDRGTKFADLFEAADIGADGACPEGFLPSNAEGRAECLKVKPGMAAVAARLETTRYASMLGASTEFRKMEGSAYDPDQNVLYLSITDIGKGMTDADAKADLGGKNAIRLEKNPCGAIYQLTLGADYKASAMTALLTGMPMDYPAESPMAGNACDVDGIANPDNLTYIPGYGTLIIAEDTDGGHQNDVIWSMNLDSGALTRILSTPYGAEATSVDWYPNVGGHAYLMAVVQHPYGESDEDKLTDPADARAYVGYVGPFPATK